MTPEQVVISEAVTELARVLRNMLAMTDVKTQREVLKDMRDMTSELDICPACFCGPYWCPCERDE